jgi:hypothetical protein
MSAANPVYMEIVDSIAGGTTPESVASFHPSEALQFRVSELLLKNEAGSLTAEERAELDQFLELEHILRIAKARARQILSQRP